MLIRRGENSCLCMNFEFAFFGGHGIFDQGALPASFLVLPGNEICLLFRPI